MQQNVNESSQTQQYLTFALAEEEYGIDILAVREIRGLSKVTRVPKTPDWMLGVLNLRGAIVPVIDLRLRFGVEQKDYDDNTVTIVVAVGERLFGMVVDAVSDVYETRESDIKPVPELDSTIETRFLKGLVGNGDRMILLLGVERLMQQEEASVMPRLLTGPASAVVA